MTKSKHINQLHGYSGTAIYEIWRQMIKRCRYPKHKNYDNYGGRGITVCERWKVFLNFLEDMGKRPEGTSLERVNNDLGYSPENCKWATHTEQMRNTRKNKRITFNNETLTLSEWSEKLGIPYHTLYTRYFTYRWPIRYVFLGQPRLPSNWKF